MNNNCPKIEPWGIPLITSDQLEKLSWNEAKFDQSHNWWLIGLFLTHVNELTVVLENYGIKVKLFTEDVKLYLQIINDI